MQELRQFTEAGISLVDELAKKFTKLNGEVVTTGDIFDKISNREVPYEMIAEIFRDMTDEGGKFYKMQEIQATSLSGMISNLTDAYHIMLDSIGEANRDMMKGFVGGMVDVMDNWEKYWAILKTIIIGYGAYRAAVIASTVAHKGLITTIKALTIVQTISNTLAKVNPYALAFAGITALIGGLVAYMDYQDRANEKLLSSITNINNQAENVNKLIDRLKDLTKETKDNEKAQAERAEIIKDLAEKEPQLAKAIKDHADNLEILVAIQERYNNIMEAKKFATYAMTEQGGIVDDDLPGQLKELAEAENKADMNAVKLENTYTHLLETWKKLKKEGSLDAGLGKIEFAKGREKQIDDILDSQKTHAEKVLEIYSLISNIGQNYKYKTKFKEGDTSDYYLYQNLFPSKNADKVKDYSRSLFDLSNISKHANEDLTKLARTLQVFFQNKDIDVFDKSNEESVRNFIKSLDELGKHGQTEILSKWNIKYEVENKPEEELDKWRKEIDERLNANNKIVFKIKADTSYEDFYDNLKKKYKEVKAYLDEQKPVLIKMGFDFEKKQFPSPLVVTNTMQQVLDNYQRNKEYEDNIKSTTDFMKIDLSDLLKDKKKGGSKKDKFTEDLKRQVELIKNAKTEYEKLKKVMSAEDALTALRSVPEYEKVNPEHISEDGYVSYLRSQVEVLNKHIKKTNSDTAKDVVITWNKELGTIQIETITKKADTELKKIEQYLSQYKDKYNLYEQIFDLTGDKGKAAEIAFGDPLASVKTHIEEMKEQLKGMSGGGIYEEVLKADQSKLPDAVRDMVKNIQEAILDEEISFKIDIAKVIADYATTQEKITAIHNKFEKEREDVRKSNLSDQEKSIAINAINKKEEDAVEELKAELYQLTPFYRQLFGDLTEISYRHLDRIVTKARETVDMIANTKDASGQLKFGQYDTDGKLTGYHLPQQNENGDWVKSDTILTLKEYERTTKRITSLYKDMRKMNPFASLSRSMSEYPEGMDNIDIMCSKMSDLNEIVQAVSGDMSGMFDALGNESAADTTAFIGEMVGAASNVAMGIASGNPVQMIQGVIGGISAIAKHHDAKLDKAIKKSQIEVKKLQNAYTDLETVVSRQLGAMTTRQAKDQVKNLEQQRKELYSQMNNEKDKKKTDWGAVADYERQISELNDQIRYFYEDLAGEQFGIKIKDWAKNISDSLVDAWSKGEDAAKSFDNTVADIMKSVFKNVLQLQYIEPAMQQLRNYLFGSDGRGGILGDGELSKRDMNGLVNELSMLKNNIGNWKTAWDALVEAAKQAGIDLEEKLEEDEEGTLQKGIQSVTEDTANLLASYINAMRADLSVQRSMVERIMQFAENNTSNFALMQADIMLIQLNTLATANNTKRLVEISEDTNTMIRRASTNGSGVKFNV